APSVAHSTAVASIRGPPQDAPRNSRAVHFARSVVNAEGARFAIKKSKQQVITDPERATDLDRPVHHAIDRLADEDFGHRALLTTRVAAVQPPGGMPDHQSRGVQLDG